MFASRHWLLLLLRPAEKDAHEQEACACAQRHATADGFAMLVRGCCRMRILQLLVRDQMGSDADVYSAVLYRVIGERRLLGNCAVSLPFCPRILQARTPLFAAPALRASLGRLAGFQPPPSCRLFPRSACHRAAEAALEAEERLLAPKASPRGLQLRRSSFLVQCVRVPFFVSPLTRSVSACFCFFSAV